MRLDAQVQYSTVQYNTIQLSGFHPVFPTFSPFHIDVFDATRYARACCTLVLYEPGLITSAWRYRTVRYGTVRYRTVEKNVHKHIY